MIQNGGFQMYCLCGGACAVVSETAGMMRTRCPVNVPYHKITHTHTNMYKLKIVIGQFDQDKDKRTSFSLWKNSWHITIYIEVTA